MYPRTPLVLPSIPCCGRASGNKQPREGLDYAGGRTGVRGPARVPAEDLLF